MSDTNQFVADLHALLEESTETVVTVEEAKARGEKVSPKQSLERKAREKRKNKTKRLGSGRNPFKTKSKLGPGPRGGRNSKSGKWKCSCSKPYQCVCRAGKRTKMIRISRAYKREYNKEYKNPEGHWHYKK